jgi:hypothetical protein
MPEKTVICLWFDTEAEEAAQHYTSIWPDAEILDTVRWGAEDAERGGGAGQHVGEVGAAVAGDGEVRRQTGAGGHRARARTCRPVATSR